MIAILAVIGLRVWARRRQDATGARFPVLWTSLALLVGLPVLAALAIGSPVSFEVPELQGFNFVGGTRVIPEFTALLVGAHDLHRRLHRRGRSRRRARGAEGADRGRHGARPAAQDDLRLIVVPQAMRVIIPPLTNQYLDLTKNSSLAVAIGYPDLVAVFAGTTLNQTHRRSRSSPSPWRSISSISLVTSLAMNIYNARIRLSER